MARSVSREFDQKFLAYHVDVLEGCGKEQAFLKLGQSLRAGAATQ